VPGLDGVDVVIVVGVADCGPAARRLCAAAESRPRPAAWADAGLVTGPDVDEEPLGVGDAVPDVLVDGLPDGDELGDAEVLGDELGVGVGLALGDVFGDVEPGWQVAVSGSGGLDATGPVDPGVTP
jgi:hypothetical protein